VALAAAFAVLTMPAVARAQGPPADSSASRTPAPASGLVADDTRNDAGRSIELAWKASPDDQPGRHVVTVT